MNRLASFILLTGCFLGGSCVSSMGQDAELGALLPPVPNLDMGYPDEKVSWWEKRRRTKAELEKYRQESIYVRTPEDTGRATFGERLQTAGRENAVLQTTKRNTQLEDLHNSIPSSDDALTPSGGRLMPFGEENDYWAGMPEPNPEEILINLAPMPDLRTPDQITWKERQRNRRLAKYEARQAEIEAKKKEKELRQRATVTGPMADPSTALVLVESQQMGGENFIGNTQAPETVNSAGTLKPFDQDSVYYQDSQMVYKGRKPTDPVSFWWKRGNNEQGGTDQNFTRAQEGRFEWRNPFRGSRDDVQPVAFDVPGATTGYGADTPSLDATPLTSNLVGIRVVKATQEVQKTGSVGVTGLVTEGVDLPPKVAAVLDSHIGSSLTLGELNQMVRDAVVAYRRSDLPVVDVLVPEQEITSGVLQLVIIEGRLGDVLVEGASQLEGRALASQIRTERGEVIRESDLTEDLAWINKHPTRQVDLIFSPGTNYGETDVILRSQAYKELQAYFAYENSGTEALGESRAIFGTSWTGPLFFGLDSILSYQFTTSFDDSDASLYGHSGVFASYLPWRHQLTLLGAFVDSNAVIRSGGASTSSGGENKQASGRYGIPLPNIGRLAHELEFGFDFKSSNSNLVFGGTQVFDTTSEIVQYSLGYNIVAPDQTGVWRVDSEVVNSPGNATSMNTDAIFMTQRTGASSSYTYGRVLIEREQSLPNDWSLLGRLQGQASSDNLLASETLGAGGYDTVRGFEQRIARGDSGVVGSLELRTPTVYPSTFAGFDNIRDGAFGLLFWDAASLSSANPLPGEVDRTLGSVGFGFRYQKEDWFTLRVDYGFQVSEEGFQDNESGRWHVGARATF